MPKINKVAHVVLAVSDVARSKAFYREVLGMEVVSDRPNQGPSAFLSFGTQHHDIAVFEDKGERTKGTLGLVHVAFQIEGGLDELAEAHQLLVRNGVPVDAIMDHGFTRSVYFHDPDGNGLEFFVEAFADQAEGLQYIRDHGGTAKPLRLPEVKVEAQA